MRLSVEWIREYTSLTQTTEEIADTLTMAGLEVEEKGESAIGSVLDIKVTPNRGDCLSVIGVARELGAAYKVRTAPFPQASSTTEGEANQYTSVAIEAPDLCARYAARIIRDVNIGESPAWMQERLLAANMRPVNNVVDITNYVMLEMGQPLHAFDYDLLKENRIVVRRAAFGETLTTLDGLERSLTPDMLAICDAARPVAIAGVMGGNDTEISENTTTILLESAHFSPTSIRRTARLLGMRTEASYRFERYVDPELVVAAADRACKLIEELGIGKVISGVADVYPRRAETRTLVARPERVGALMGYEITGEEVRSSLEWLGIYPAEAPNTYIIPGWRPDLAREIDLVEEVGRVMGYERIPEQLPVGVTTIGKDTTWNHFAEQVRDIFIGAGLQEVVTHSLIRPSVYEDSTRQDSRISIRSALSAELSGLRRSLLPGLIETLDYNARRGLSPLAFFEVGRVFHLIREGYEETTAIGGVLAGPLSQGFWQKSSGQSPADFYTVRGLIDRLFQSLATPEIELQRREDPRLHPGRSANILLDGKVVGFIGELHPNLRKELTARERINVFELMFEPLQEAARRIRRFKPWSDTPSVVRDLAPRVDQSLPYESIRQAIAETNIPILQRIALIDLYTGAGIPEGMKSLTLSFTFHAPERTLTEEEVSDALATLRSALERECGASFVGR
jgi:phenylalanyl-tRNA synthetase beta chain